MCVCACGCACVLWVKREEERECVCGREGERVGFAQNPHPHSKHADTVIRITHTRCSYLAGRTGCRKSPGCQTASGKAAVCPVVTI